MTIPQTKLPQLISPPLDPLMLSNQAKKEVQLFHSEQLIQSKNNLAAIKSVLKFFNHFVDISKILLVLVKPLFTLRLVPIIKQLIMR